MQYATYSFTCNFVRDAVLPEYKGAVFYNRLGSYLKRAACFFKNGACDACRHSRHCDYSKFYEIPRSIVAAKKLPVNSPPRPFIIEPPLTTETEIPAGAAFDFNLVLFGSASTSAEYFIRALDAFSQEGIGNPRSPLAIKEVRGGDQVVYRDGKMLSERAVTTETLSAPAIAVGAAEEGLQEKVLNIMFESPLRRKGDRQAAPDPPPELPFVTLVRMMLQRTSSLFGCYDAETPALDYKGLIEAAKQATVAETNLEWVGSSRRPLPRQHKALLGGAVIGSVTYSGFLEPFMPLIRLCERLHIGRQLTFGLGKLACKEIY